MSDTDQFDDAGILLRTIWGEARGEGYAGMQAVANVIVNRAKSGITWWGKDVRSCCLKAWQFSCWNSNDPNRAKLINLKNTDPQYPTCAGLAGLGLAGRLDDNTNGATSYYDSRMPHPPPWSIGKEPCAVIGHHRFYKGV